MALDFSTDHGKMALKQLENEVVIWLTTVTPKGVPQPNPVWFIWHDDCVITWVQPGSARMRNLPNNSNVSLHFATDPNASHVTVLTGVAEADESIGSFRDYPAYGAKYDDRWQHLDMTPESADKLFSLPIRIRPAKLRGF